MEELRECPCCGPGKSVVELYRDDNGKWIIGCGACGSHSGVSPKNIKDDVVKRWNTRASDATIKELVDGLTKLRSVFSGAPFNDFNISICHNIDKLISTATGIK